MVMELNPVLNPAALSENEAEEEERAKLDIWRYAFGFVETATVKCAIELGIPDAVDNANPITLQDLAYATSSDPHLLFRIMRFLINRRIFKEKHIKEGKKGYVHTPLSRLFMKNELQSMSALVLMETSPVMLKPWHYLSKYVKGNVSSPFTGAHGVDVWSFAGSHPEHSDLISQAMACDARLVMANIVNGCPDVFENVTSVVDVGGADGTALSVLVQSCPWIHGTNLDLPHVVPTGLKMDNLKHVAGNMFIEVPKADVAFIMWVLHDWNDEDCIQILINCRQAVTSKVIIVEAVLDDEPDHGANKLKDAGLMLDMIMMAHTNSGKERTLSEWKHILNRSGFSTHSIKPIPGTIQSLIQAIP